MKEEKSPLLTLTGEPYQPVRIHYDLFDKEGVKEVLLQIECFRFDVDKNRWEWLYKHEAVSLKFRNPHSAIPEEMRPVVLGILFFKTDEKMFFDLHSFGRAAEAIVFFDRYIDRSMAEVKDIEIVNKLFDRSTDIHQHLDVFFGTGKARKKNDPEDLLRKLSMIASDTIDKKEKARLFSSYLDEIARTPIPEIEILPSNYYEDGISSLKSRLMTRQILAFKHWEGDARYTLFDLMNEILPVKD